MAHSDDHIALAAEYALGTLDAGERAQVESMMSVDAEFMAMVQAWQWRLGVLNQMVGEVEPRTIVWENIQNSIGHAGPQAAVILPRSPVPPPVQPAARAHAPVAPIDNANVIRLTRQRRAWRGIAGAVSALAAALLALLGLQKFNPDLLPNALRPTPQTKVVEVKTPAPVPSSQYVAVLQGQAGTPAFILTVDGASRNFTVRRVGAAAPEPGKAYELWMISDKLARPRSLGVVDAGDFTSRPVLASYDADVINNATFAVTVEQAGGSPDGVPHSTPVYSGKLIQTVPPHAVVPSQPQKR